MQSPSPTPLSSTFITAEQVRTIGSTHGTPCYVYSEERILKSCNLLASMPNAFGLKPRFAMKACPTGAVIKTITAAGIGIDASSGYEVERAIKCGVSPREISLTAQELPINLPTLLESGIEINACSHNQLRVIGEALNGIPSHSRMIGVRFNPGMGSGQSNRTNVGGPASGFGVWHEYLAETKKIADQYKLKITRVHSHIGSGADAAVWERCAKLTLTLATNFPDVTTINLGGGFQIARMHDESESDLQETGRRISQEFQGVFQLTGRKLALEVEPGAYLMAKAGVVISKVIDLTDTGSSGYKFVKLDTGMTEIIRPAMYGAQHPVIVVPAEEGGKPRGTGNYLVIGHCCESGDILTPEEGDPEGLKPRCLEEPRIGDFVVIGSTGAYTSGFSAVNYNSFPQAAEVMIRGAGIELVKKRQTVEQMIVNEF